MAVTYDPISTTTLGSTTATVTFSSIPSTYTDLVLVCANLNSVGGNDDMFCQFNSDSGTNYSDTDVYGNGSSALSVRHTNSVGVKLTYVTTTLNGLIRANIMNYSNSTTYKTTILRDDAAVNVTAARVSLWRSTSAITSMTLTRSTGGGSTGFASGSMFTLYGITAA